MTYVPRGGRRGRCNVRGGGGPGLTVADLPVHAPQTHVSRGAVSVYVYHGAARTTDEDELRRHDVVITTYSILASEIIDSAKNAAGENVVLNNPGPLQRIHWLRLEFGAGWRGRVEGTGV